MLNIKQNQKIKNPLVSIIILVYNAPLLTLQTLYTLKRTKDVDYEVIVLDNNSRLLTKVLLLVLFYLNFINKLITSKENTYFARGNNLAVTYSNSNSKYYLLLNSDIKIINPFWLKLMLDNHKYGISSIGICDKGQTNARCDGYCFLINKNLYDKYKLDENYKWWYGITKLQTQILNQKGCHVRGCEDDSTIIKHYWGGSGKAYTKVLNIISIEEINMWFSNTINKFEIFKLGKNSENTCRRKRERERERVVLLIVYKQQKYAKVA